MKIFLLPFAFCLLLAGCASVTPVGTWDYSVTGTPQGDYAGTMVITQNKKEYAAILDSQGTALPFNKFSFDKKAKKAKGGFDFQNTPISFDAIVMPNEMTGHMSTDDAQFPFKATRRK